MQTLLPGWHTGSQRARRGRHDRIRTLHGSARQRVDPQRYLPLVEDDVEGKPIFDRLPRQPRSLRVLVPPQMLLTLV